MIQHVPECGKANFGYHKQVSKIPPTPEETQDFIELIDRLRSNHKSGSGEGMIGVHCHYGFNRTGFFICAYLIERKGFSTRQALEEFKVRLLVLDRSIGFYPRLLIERLPNNGMVSLTLKSTEV